MTDARRNWSPQKPACSSLVLAAAIDSLPKYRIDILLPREIRRQSSSEESQMEQHDFSRVGLVIASE